MKRIRVPETRIKEVADKIFPAIDREQVRAVCNAFAESLSEHPQVPTDEQWAQLRDWDSNTSSFDTFFRHVIAEWQRRCFVQEEPEIPAEVAFLLKRAEMGDVPLRELLLESYRQGLRKGEQK